MNFILRWLATAVAVGVAVWIVPGINIVGGTESWVAIGLTALILALIDMTIKPILQTLSLPITIVSLGVFYIVVNAVLLCVATGITNGIFHVGFEIASFGSAFLAAIIISIVGTILNGVIRDDD